MSLRSLRLMMMPAPANRKQSREGRRNLSCVLDPPSPGSDGGGEGFVGTVGRGEVRDNTLCLLYISSGRGPAQGPRPRAGPRSPGPGLGPWASPGPGPRAPGPGPGPGARGSDPGSMARGPGPGPRAIDRPGPRAPGPGLWAGLQKHNKLRRSSPPPPATPATPTPSMKPPSQRMVGFRNSIGTGRGNLYKLIQ